MSELRKYGVLLTTAKALKFALYKQDGLTYATSATVTFAIGDVKISKDGGAYANTTNLPVAIGSSWYLVLTATELTAESIDVLISDATATQVWLDTEISIETYGHASALHAFDLDTAAEAMRGTDNAALASVCTEPRLAELAAANIPANIDTLLGRIIGTLATGTHNPASAAQIAVLSDWINAGRLDTILDTINSATGGLAGAAMRGTDGANTVAPDNATIATIAGYLDTEITALLTATQTDIPALISALNNLSADQVNTEADTALVDFFTSIVQLKLDIANGVWSDTLTAYVNGEAGKRVKGITAVPVLEGTVNDVAASATVFKTTLTGYGDTFFDDALILLEIAPDQWQGRPVAAYVSTTGEFTLDEPLISAPANGIAIAVQATHIHPVTEIREEIDANSTQLATVISNQTAISGQISALNDPTAAAVAAAVAAYDMGNGRTIEEALAFLRNKWEIVAGVLTVYDTDDTTVLWTSAMTQTAGNPVSASDPA